MMKILELKTLKNTVDNIGKVSLIHKVLNDIAKARALYFIKKIKSQGIRNNLYQNLSTDLINTNGEILNEKRKPLIKQIIKIYTYKVLYNLFNRLDAIKKNNTLLEMGDFFMKLYQINIRKKRKKYRRINRYQGNPNIKKGMKLHINIKPTIKKRDEINNKIIVYKELTPSFIKYLNNIFKRRKINIFDSIKYNKYCLGDKFSKLLKIFAKKSIIPDKEDLVDSLKYYVYMKITKMSASDKLYYLIRRAIIRKLLKMSKIIGNLNRTINLIKITLTHKNITKDRYLLNLIKKWRFVVFVKKMATKKMELMYKDLHVTYLEMADSVLNEGSPLGPNGANFLHDVNKDKCTFDFYDPYLVKGSKPYKAIRKEYIFEPVDNEFEKSVKIIKETETINRIKKINKNFYDYDYNESNERINKTEIKNTKYEKNEMIPKIPIKNKKVIVKKVNQIPIGKNDLRKSNNNNERDINKMMEKKQKYLKEIIV